MPFSFAVNSPSTRIGQTVMLILSSINFKIAVTTRLPTVSYLTILDKYALTALIYLAVLCIYHSIIGSPLFSSNSTSTLNYYDQIFLIFFACSFFLFHATYAAFFMFKFLKHKKMEINANKLQEPVNDFWISDMHKFKSSSPISANSINPLIR